MKYLAIMTAITNLDGSISMVQLTEEEKKERKIPDPTTVKDVIMQYIINFTSDGNDYKKMMRTKITAEKMFKHKIDKLELEDAELDIIEEAVKKGIPQRDGKTFHHPDIILAQVYEVLEQAKKDDEDRKAKDKEKEKKKSEKKDA